MENNLVIKNGLYRHFKGNYYIVEKLASMHDDPDNITPYVVYTSVKNGHTCLRKLSDFFADVSQREDNVTGQKQRFEVAVEVTGVLSLIDTQTILAEVEKRPDNPYEGCLKLEDDPNVWDVSYLVGRVVKKRSAETLEDYQEFIPFTPNVFETYEDAARYRDRHLPHRPDATITRRVTKAID